MILHELGLRHLSPTVNMFFYPKDYIRFLQNLRYYLQCPVVQSTSDKRYPVGKIDDIRLMFMHYPDFDTAKKKWQERCQRVNMENLYVMMVQRDNCTYEDVKAFGQLPFEHKVCLTAFPYPDLKYTYCIEGTNEGGQVMDLCKYKGPFSGRRWIDDFDYISFFNKGVL